ncbi:hypothetical protein M8C21_025466 [Ambrosia artemisiifolia]|uniref:Uncharacterized protein n=1 Tax=Ambrosia artemisiifolia TaxID=4212 RepID=A0AAD5BLF0_AMBAR|nr:hypothetical protein M8C21_025466 [Ambrosia artemisiifolia]
MLRGCCNTVKFENKIKAESLEGVGIVLGKSRRLRCKVMLQVADLSDDATKENIEDGLKLNEKAQERPMIISCFQPDVALIMKKLRHKYPIA